MRYPIDPIDPIDPEISNLAKSLTPEAKARLRVEFAAIDAALVLAREQQVADAVAARQLRAREAILELESSGVDGALIKQLVKDVMRTA